MYAIICAIFELGPIDRVAEDKHLLDADAHCEERQQGVELGSVQTAVIE